MSLVSIVSCHPVPTYHTSKLPTRRQSRVVLEYRHVVHGWLEGWCLASRVRVGNLDLRSGCLDIVGALLPHTGQYVSRRTASQQLRRVVPVLGRLIGCVDREAEHRP